MAVGTLDLASVTDALIDALGTAIDASPLWTVNGGPVAKFTVNPSGQAPDVAREIGDCQLCLTLVHVAPNATWRNRSVPGPGGIVVPIAPIALDLSYALIAFAGKDFVREQQAMSIALAWIAANPIQRLVVAAVPPHSIDCTLTLETATLDEIARLWQSFAGAMRLTSLLRVSTVFVGPDPVIAAPAAPPTRLGLAVAPAQAVSASPQLLAVTEPVLVTAGNPGASEAPLSPGETAVVAGLGLAGTERLFLSPADDSSDIDITAWVSNRRANTLRLTLPAIVGAPPAAAPVAGTYRLRIGAAPKTGASIPLEVGAP